MPLYPPSNLDANQVLQHAFDEANQRLRTDTIVNTTIEGAVEVAIHHTDDDILIYGADSGGTHRVIRTDTNGNIKTVVTNGTDELTIHDDGSIKTVQLFTLPFDTITGDDPDPSPIIEIYRSRIGGASGTVQQIVTITYRDATKNRILKVVRT